MLGLAWSCVLCFLLEFAVKNKFSVPLLQRFNLLFHYYVYAHFA